MKVTRITTSPQLKSLLVALLLLSLVFSLVACKEATVKVRTGTRIVCKYGELLKDRTKVIRVPKSQASKYHVVTLRKLCKKHRKLERLRETARDALREGNDKEAKEIIKQMVKKEPELKAAIENKGNEGKAQLEAIEKALAKQQAESIAKLEKQSNPSGSYPAGNNNPVSPPASASPNSPVASSSSSEPPANEPSPQAGASQFDLVSLLPVSITGYYTGSVNAGTNFAVADFQPKSSKEVEFLLITVSLKDGEESAKRFLEKVSKVAFSYDSAAVAVDGRSAYFGTDQTTYANLSWYSDKVVYEVQMMSATGKPKALYDYIVNIGTLLAQGAG